MFLIAVLILLSFFQKAGVVGKGFMSGATFLIGRVVFVTPILFLSIGLIFFTSEKRTKRGLGFLAVLLLILGLSGILGALSSEPSELFPHGAGGLMGSFTSNALGKLIGYWGALVSFLCLVVVGSLALFYLFWPYEESLWKKISDLKAERKGRSKKKAEEERERKSITERAQEKAKEQKERFEEGISKIKKKKGGKKETEVETKPIFEKSEEGEEKEKKPKPPQVKFKKPPLKLLAKEEGNPDSGNISNNSAIIKRTLKNFDIEVEMSEVNVGPTVTQYTLKPAQGIKLSKIESLNKDLALALARHPIRIEAPIPGRSLVGVEVPNEVRARVRLKDLVSSSDFKDDSPLNLALGKDVSGDAFYADLARMPHLLIAGSTGSGKTVCLNSIMMSLLYQNSPITLRIVVVDPKRVEFPVYEDLPHLLGDIIFQPDQAVRTLKWLVSEMERRFDVLSGAKAKDIYSYNEENDEPLPYIVLIIDELADLMAAKGSEVEEAIVRLAQMARAVGIHLVVATQRPSVEVVTGLIKANITSRIAFQVASQVDSRTVLDMSGAEKLLGSGDLLFISSRHPKPKRVQGAYISREEINEVVKWVIENQTREAEVEKEDELSKELEQKLEQDKGRTLPGEDDELYDKAKKIIIRNQKASASFLQRRMRVGYARAARLIDALEKEGVVGPSRGSKPREVFMSKEESELDFDNEGYED